MGILFLNGGLMTTVQDAGRRGYQRFGMPVSGAADIRSYTYANLLAGNDPDEAVLEVTLSGPVIEFTTPAVIAVTGGDLSPKVNEKPCPMYRAVQINKGDILSFGMVSFGCRAYIAFTGGLAIPPAMGSRSTYIRAGLGGYEGRKLEKGDEIAFRRPGLQPVNIKRRVMKPEVFGGTYTLRVLMGPQEEKFTAEGIAAFLGSVYSVTNESDRMGCRLSGPEIARVTDSGIISDGIAFGAVQVPDTGEPIIMLSDRQTTGGYAKIACVISADIPMAAQCKAGDKLRFVKTDIRTAQDAVIEEQKKYQAMREYFDADPDKENVLQKVIAKMRYRLLINGKPFDVSVEEKS